MNILVADTPVPYPDAMDFMDSHVDSMIRGVASPLAWFLEHPPLYTAGTSARPSDLLSDKLPVYTTGRGGQYTYHGPGQRIIYCMIPLSFIDNDIRRYIASLEQIVIDTLRDFSLEATRFPPHVGVWVALPHGMKKIAAIGVRVRKGIAFHGLSLNVCPNLAHYDGIIPCGLSDYGVASLHALGVYASMADVDAVCIRHLNRWTMP